MLREKVLDPLFESWTDFRIEREILVRLGYEKYLPKTAEENVAACLANSTDPTVKGITVEKLLANNGIMSMDVPSEPCRLYSDYAFGTSSGRMDLYYESLLADGQAFPNDERGLEAYSENPLAKKYPLQFQQSRTKFSLHSQFYNSTWIRQFHEPSVQLNPVDGAARGLKDGDLVDVFNDRGSFGMKYQSDSSVRPGTARVYEGMWSKYTAHGNIQEVTSDVVNPRGYKMVVGPIVPFNDTLVEVKKA
jgi:molybdopterin-containing oxidoreductase family molybdopterin binding subunit